MSILNRRKFLQQSAILTSAGAVSSLLSFPSYAGWITPASPVVKTKYGELRGYEDDGIKVFKGIPYGADTAKRRFMPPAPSANWEGIREALNYGPSAPQKSGGNISEDCLYLNVFTPAIQNDNKRTVTFYIHGGAYSKPYNLSQRQTMLFDIPPKLENDPRGEERKIFEGSLHSSWNLMNRIGHYGRIKFFTFYNVKKL